MNMSNKNKRNQKNQAVFALNKYDLPRHRSKLSETPSLPRRFQHSAIFFLLFFTAAKISTMARKKKKRKKGRDATSAWPKGRPTIGDDPLLITKTRRASTPKSHRMRDFWGGQPYRPYPNRNYMSLKKSEIWVRDLCTVVRQNATVASTKDLGRIQNLSIPNQNMS
ncbi:hypothetical protein E4U09_005272 [Claviceps aff. purpurea]|uniref:Uncharacterized protein n=1 Tax=Claviceps aff. purpurea TaxID=1967640 RepID=A0A9P7QRK6_9HYPO|nr:hypothetical protein E4U09_005272 [Claviceps aff. purpurea]